MRQFNQVVKIVFTLVLIFGLDTQYYAECGNTARPRTGTTRATTVQPKATPSRPPTTTQPITTPVNCVRDLSDPNQAVEKHPVSRLYEIQAQNHAKAPIFAVIGHRGEQNKNNQEFQVQVTVNDKTASAWAHTKKKAKRQAAIQMLHLMGLQVESDSSNSVTNSC